MNESLKLHVETEQNKEKVIAEQSKQLLVIENYKTKGIHLTALVIFSLVAYTTYSLIVGIEHLTTKERIIWKDKVLEATNYKAGKVFTMSKEDKLKYYGKDLPKGYELFSLNISNDKYRVLTLRNSETKEMIVEIEADVKVVKSLKDYIKGLTD